MPDFGVIVTFLIIYYGAADFPLARWEEKMSSPVLCLAAVTDGLLAEAQRHGSIANGGSITFACQLDMPEAKEH